MSTRSISLLVLLACLAAQLPFGVLFGILGLALATPIAAALMTIAQRAYVRDYLERDARSPAG